MSTTKRESSMRAMHWSLILSLSTAAAGCMSIEERNAPPTARIDVEMDGVAVDDPSMIAWSGEPLTITLSGESSDDPDGTIREYLWFRTDVPRELRNPTDAGTGTAGMGAAGMGAAGMDAPATPPFDGDPEPGETTDVSLSAPGTYRFSLWVVDDDDGVSEPASVTLTVVDM
jgi:hypothetical protein